MFCKQCGTECQNQARFCPACGEALTAESVPAPSVSPEEVPTPSVYPEEIPVSAAPARKSPLKIIIPAVCLAAVLVLLLLNLGNLSAAITAKKALGTAADYDFVKVLDYVHDDMVDKILEEEGMDRDELKDLLKEASKDAKEYMEEDGESIGYKVLGISSIRGDDLDELKDHYDDDFDMDVKAAKSIELEIFMKDHGRRSEKGYVYITMLKVDGKWYPAIDLLLDYL